MSEPTRHLMLDLETMGNGPRAAVIQIGACLWTPVRPGETIIGPSFRQSVTLESSMSLGLELTASTVDWWLTQSDAAIASVTEGAIHLARALQEFSKFYRQSHAGPIWGNGATFDNVILRSAYVAAGHNCPWDFHDDRDVRTLKALGDAAGVDYKIDRHPGAVEHDARDDAIHQARYCALIWDELTTAPNRVGTW